MRGFASFRDSTSPFSDHFMSSPCCFTTGEDADGGGVCLVGPGLVIRASYDCWPSAFWGRYDPSWLRMNVVIDLMMEKLAIGGRKVGDVSAVAGCRTHVRS